MYLNAQGIKQWENLTNREQHPNLVLNSKVRFIGDKVGFSAMDGFSQNDLYAGGNKGDFWHYDGKSMGKKKPCRIIRIFPQLLVRRMTQPMSLAD